MPDFSLIKLEKTNDYKPAEPFVLQTCNYLLTTPVTKGNDSRLKSVEFIFKWMSGTPDFSFTFDDPFIKMIKDNPNTTGLYMAAMAKYSLENREASKDSKLVKTNAIKALLQYCENKDNNLKMTKQLKKLAEARDSGTLEEML